MAKKIVIKKEGLEKNEDKFKYCQALEDGNILFFPSIPFDFPQNEIDFLLMQKQGNSKTRGEIAYKPDVDRITNHHTSDLKDAAKLKEILSVYSRRSTGILQKILSPYANGWKLDHVSFRPFQEREWNLRARARNDPLHIDAFPTRPLHGSRILRFFTNINPTENRQWITSEKFEKLVEKYGNKVSIPNSVGYDLKSRFERKMKKFLKSMGVKVSLCSPYDHYMLRMHHFLKESQEFQQSCKKDHWDFPPLSCWAVFTDEVSHASLAGQYALEQTFIIPQKVLLCPEKSPVSVLQRLSGKNLIDPELLREVFPT